MASTHELQQYARQVAQHYGLDPRIFVRQISAESDWNPNSYSSAGARGIAQIMPDEAKSWGIDPMDSHAALNAAAKHMATMVRKYGSYRKALAGYNAGEGAVAKYNGVPPYAETQNYVRKILGGIHNATYPGQKPKVSAPTTSGSTDAQSGQQTPAEAPPLSLAAQVNPNPQVPFSSPVAPAMLDTSKYLGNSAAGTTPQLPSAAPAMQTTNQTPTDPTTTDTAQTAPAATPIKVKDLPAAHVTSGIQNLVARMDKIDAQHRVYVYGGGHGSAPSVHNSKPIDCSAAVSLALKLPVRVSGDFAGWGKPGRSSAKNAVNVYFNGGHVFMEVNGHFWGTSHSNPGGGAGWIPRSVMDPAYLKGFSVHHEVM
jgi:hypothetical protein